LKLAKFNPDDYDVVPFPRGKTNNTVIGIGAAPIFKASQHKDEAWEFAKYLSSKEFQDTFVVADGWSIPAVKSAAEKLQATEGFPKNGSIFYDSADTGVLVPAPSAYGEIEAALTREFGAAMANSKSVEEAMAAADKDVTAALAKYAKK
jgi:multiple sugar transport system substrate-binding protein